MSIISNILIRPLRLRVLRSRSRIKAITLMVAAICRNQEIFIWDLAVPLNRRMVAAECQTMGLKLPDPAQLLHKRPLVLPQAPAEDILMSTGISRLLRLLLLPPLLRLLRLRNCHSIMRHSLHQGCPSLTTQTLSLFRHFDHLEAALSLFKMI
jgi:hypothetical protein